MPPARGSRAQGHRYERALGKLLCGPSSPFSGTWNLGQWFEFEDAAGRGYAQPDAFLVRPTDVLLLEAKLSYREGAWIQMKALYVPLLEAHCGLPCVCVQVTKNVRGAAGKVVAEPEALVDGDTWHWLGRA